MPALTKIKNLTSKIFKYIVSLTRIESYCIFDVWLSIFLLRHMKNSSDMTERKQENDTARNSKKIKNSQSNKSNR